MKRKICTLCSAILVVSLLAGCSSSPSGTTSSGESTEKTTITIMQSKVEIQSDLQKAVDEYNTTQSNVTVKLLGASGDNYTPVLQSQFSSQPEKAPTIFTFSGPDTVKFNNFMAPLGDTKSASLIPDTFKSEVSVAGEIYGIPMGVEGYGLIYNKDMFQKAGIEAAQINSIDALVSASKKLQSVQGVEHPIAFAKDNFFIFIHPFNWAFAVDSNYAADIKAINSGSKTMADIPSVKQWAKDLDAIKPYTNSGLNTYDDQVAGFASGKYAMIHQGDWVQTMLEQDKVSFQYGMIPYPTGGNTKLAVDVSNAWHVNKYASDVQQKAAKDFIDWISTSEKGQSYCADTFKFIPALKGMKAPSGALAQDIASYVNKDQIIPWVYNTDFPSGIDGDGAAWMQAYYANQINSDQLLTQLTQLWAQSAQ